jgi:hypothetical protein
VAYGSLGLQLDILNTARHHAAHIPAQTHLGLVAAIRNFLRRDADVKILAVSHGVGRRGASRQERAPRRRQTVNNYTP